MSTEKTEKMTKEQKDQAKKQREKTITTLKDQMKKAGIGGSELLTGNEETIFKSANTIFSKGQTSARTTGKSDNYKKLNTIIVSVTGKAEKGELNTWEKVRNQVMSVGGNINPKYTDLEKAAKSILGQILKTKKEVKTATNEPKKASENKQKSIDDEKEPEVSEHID